MKTVIRFFLMCVAAVVVIGSTTACRTNEVLYVDDDPTLEGRVCVQRPQVYSLTYALFGINTLAEVLEITYVELEPNAANQNVLKVGIRYKGYSSWYNFWRSSPREITIGAEAKFYKASTIGNKFGVPVFTTDERQLFTLRLGDTYDYTTTCPRAEGRDFQLFISN